SFSAGMADSALPPLSAGSALPPGTTKTLAHSGHLIFLPSRLPLLLNFLRQAGQLITGLSAMGLPIFRVAEFARIRGNCTCARILANPATKTRPVADRMRL